MKVIDINGMLLSARHCVGFDEEEGVILTFSARESEMGKGGKTDLKGQGRQMMGLVWTS